ncbi:hypothetical protein NDU88_001687 [Pleurodeles waltl]|uniref:Uncharacterized protein n=1 Tax=Pleurodeles waltl TaxID=8319 RepID=A0AAV7U8S3_PLEWA|nr:hypothetical protein NDU88_001687 [Pleurodeles waltl]
MNLVPDSKGRGQDGGVSGRAGPSSTARALKLLHDCGACRPVSLRCDAWCRGGRASWALCELEELEVGAAGSGDLGAGALVTSATSVLGPSGWNPREEGEWIGGLSGRLELVRRFLGGAVDLSHRSAVLAAHGGLTQSGGERCWEKAHRLSCGGWLVTAGEGLKPGGRGLR